LAVTLIIKKGKKNRETPGEKRVGKGKKKKVKVGLLQIYPGNNVDQKSHNQWWGEKVERGFRGAMGEKSGAKEPSKRGKEELGGWTLIPGRGRQNRRDNRIVAGGGGRGKGRGPVGGEKKMGFL